MNEICFLIASKVYEFSQVEENLTDLQRDGVIGEKIDKDITDEKWDGVYIPYENNFNDFLIKYVVPEIFSFQLASSY